MSSRFRFSAKRAPLEVSWGPLLRATGLGLLLQPHSEIHVKGPLVYVDRNSLFFMYVFIIV